MRKFAIANMRRYKKIIAQNKVLNGDDIAAQVQQVINEVLSCIDKLSTDMTQKIIILNEK